MLRTKIAIYLLASMLFVWSACGTKKSSQQSSGAPQENTQATNQNNNQMPESNNPPAAPTETKLIIPAGSQLLVTLDETIETNTNRAGDEFSGHLGRGVVVNGQTAIPEGSRVDLVITSLVKGGRLKTPPEIAFTVKSVTLPNGESYPINAGQVFEKGRSHTKREVGMIGGGAAAGAIIGGVLGKGKGALIGGAAGAAAGTGTAAATGRQNLVYAAGRSIDFTLKQPMVISAKQ